MPGESVANGAKRYSYSAAGFLVKVETYSTDWQSQAEMAYDGLGNRLEMTGYADGQSVTTQYALDGGQVLTASAGDLTTTYLYGLGPIGELTDSWSYGLPDGANTQRQLVNTNGEVTLTSSYTPWGDTLEVNGKGTFTQGYFGGVTPAGASGAGVDTATGLLYVGNGTDSSGKPSYIAYCPSSPYENGIFNYLGAYSQSAKGRYNDLLEGKIALVEQAPTNYVNLLAEGYTIKKIGDDVVINPLLTIFNNNEPVHFGNDPDWNDNLCPDTDVTTFSTEINAVFYKGSGENGVSDFVYTINQDNYGRNMKPGMCRK